MIRETGVQLADGRNLHVYDTGEQDGTRLTLGVDRFAVMGHSGGAPHALALGALLPERVIAIVCVATLAPFGAEGLDWFAGMGPAGEAALRAATAGRRALEEHLATADFDPEMFTDADQASAR